VAKILLNDLEYSEHELSLLLTGDKEIASLNNQYRNKSSATDVLSFSQLEGEGHSEEKLLGDVVISVETASRQAQETAVSLEEELVRLLIHGTLHLMGYDHENVSEAEVKEMENLEEKFLEKAIVSLAK